ncbi:MAG: hypothetical protein QW399_05805 [Sulfolobales archaeon]
MNFRIALLQYGPTQDVIYSFEIKRLLGLGIKLVCRMLMLNNG